MRGKGKSGATTATKENAVNTVAKKAESTIEAVAEKAKEAVKKVEVKEEAVKETLAETKANVKAACNSGNSSRSCTCKEDGGKKDSCEKDRNKAC